MPLTKGQQGIYESVNGFDIEDPYHLLCLFDEEVVKGSTNGGIDAYQWQIDALLEFGRPRNTYEDVIRAVVCANNGSGKSRLLVAPCAVWLPMRFKRGRVVITSASGNQLDNQVCRSINNLCNSVNKIYKEKFGFVENVWQINYRSYTFLPTGGIIECFATDEEGKAEGYHPTDFGSEFAIIVDEGKSVPENIYEAIMRCNGMTRRIDVSSPGAPKGHFYKALTSGRWWSRKVQYKDCPRHVRESEVNEARLMYGESSPLFRSMYLGEFTSAEEQVVIGFEHMSKCYGNNPLFKPYSLSEAEIMQPGKFAGLDLAAGGDENVLSVFNGNVQEAIRAFKHYDTTITVDFLIGMIREHNLNPEHINADDGGVGHAVIDMLWRKGYMVQRIINQGRPANNVIYGNLGAENWFNFKRYVEESFIKLLPDEKQKEQLSSRYYRQPNAGKIYLESKAEARAKNRKSPDRADAAVNAWRFKPFNTTFDIARNGAPTVVSKAESLTMEEIVEKMEAVKYDLSNHSGSKQRDFSGRFNFSEYADDNNAGGKILHNNGNGYGEQINNLNNFLKRN